MDRAAHRLERRRLLQAIAAAAALPALPAASAPAASVSSSAPQVGTPLVVGGLPVTCNLTLPLACAARGGNVFEYLRITSWPKARDALASGQIKAAYMLAPMVMDLADQGVPVKIISLGHRSGAVIMVRKDAPFQNFKDLRGRRVAIPSRYAVDLLFLRKMLARERMSESDVKLVEMEPPDMPAALYAKTIDAFCTGEPFGAAAQKAGFARPLRMTRDEWRNYICCVLAVREELIREQPALLQDLVNHVQAAGLWLDSRNENRTKASQIAAAPRFFNQDPKIIQFVMENPIDRVTYGDLRLLRGEFDELMELSIAAGMLKKPVAYERYVDERFARAIKPVPVKL